MIIDYRWQQKWQSCWAKMIFYHASNYLTLPMIYLRPSLSYNSRAISRRDVSVESLFFPLSLSLLLFTPWWRGYGYSSVTSSLVADFYVSVVHAAVPAKYGGYRSNHSRWCTRVTVTAWALAGRGACGDEGQTGAPTGEFLPVRLSASSLLYVSFERTNMS